MSSSNDTGRISIGNNDVSIESNPQNESVKGHV